MATLFCWIIHSAPGQGSKVRPCLVVQNDRDNARTVNVIVAMITRNVSRVAEPTQLLVEHRTPEGQQAGLHADSAVNCLSLFTVNEALIRRKIGRLPTTMMRQVDDCLKSALELT